MTLKVYKYAIQLDDYLTIEMHDVKQFLHVDVQGDVPHVWALVDPSTPTRKRRFRLVGTGTGHFIASADAVKHVGSFLMHGGALVFHLFDRGWA